MIFYEFEASVYFSPIFNPLSFKYLFKKINFLLDKMSDKLPTVEEIPLNGHYFYL